MEKTGRKSIWDTPPGNNPGEAESEQGWGSLGESQVATKLLPPAVPIVEQLRVAEQKKRERRWELDNKTRSYWGIPVELREALGWIAQEQSVKVDDVVRAFFEYGLEENKKGALGLDPYPNFKGPKLTLYPGGWRHQPWSRENWNPNPTKISKTDAQRRKRVMQSSKGANCVLAVRHLPIELHQAIVTIAGECPVPIGEVVMKFLGYGLEAFSKGALILNPVPAPGSNTLFPVEK